MATDEMVRADGLSEVLSAWKSSSGAASPGAVEPAFWLDQASLDDLYRTNVYAQRICCALPDESTRRGWEISYGDDMKGGDDSVGDELWRIGLRDLLNRAGKLARKDGIAAIYLGVDDGQETMLAVDPSRIRRVTHATLMERDQFQPHSWQSNFLEPGFAEPDVYAIFPYSAMGTSVPNAYVHRSRMLVLGGIWLPPRLQNENSNSHDSVLQRCWRLVMDFRRTEGDLGVLLRSYSTGTLTMPQLQALLAGKNRDAALERLRMISISRDMLGTVLLGDGEKMEWVTRSAGGLSELYDRLAQGVAAAAEMPLTVLFGHSPSGLSTDDEAGWRWWKTRVASYQRNDLHRHVEYVGRLLALAKDGPCKGEEPEKWEVAWLPLDEQSEAEKTDQRSKQATTDKTYLEMGVLSAGEVRLSRFGRGQWSGETALIEGEDPTQAGAAGAAGAGAPASGAPGGAPGGPALGAPVPASPAPAPPAQKADSDDDGLVARDAAIRRASLVLASRMRVDLAYDIPADYFRVVMGQIMPFIGEPGSGAPLAGNKALVEAASKGASAEAAGKASSLKLKAETARTKEAAKAAKAEARKQAAAQMKMLAAGKKATKAEAAKAAPPAPPASPPVKAEQKNINRMVGVSPESVERAQVLAGVSEGTRAKMESTASRWCDEERGGNMHKEAYQAWAKATSGKPGGGELADAMREAREKGPERWGKALQLAGMNSGGAPVESILGYRGMHGVESATSVVEAWRTGAALTLPSDELASWSFDPKLAERFTRGNENVGAVIGRAWDTRDIPFGQLTEDGKMLSSEMYNEEHEFAAGTGRAGRVVCDPREARLSIGMKSYGWDQREEALAAYDKLGKGK